MGRPRTPTALHVLKGERAPVGVVEPPAGPVACPSNLGDGARAVWERLAPGLEAKKVLTAWDVDEFAAFCDAVDRRDKAQAALDREGEVTEQPVFDRNGNETGHRVALNPWWQVWKGANDAMGRFGGRFGLTPADRAALKVDNGSKPEDTAADFLTG